MLSRSLVWSVGSLLINAYQHAMDISITVFQGSESMKIGDNNILECKGSHFHTYCTYIHVICQVYEF